MMEATILQKSLSIIIVRVLLSQQRMDMCLPDGIRMQLLRSR